MEFVGRHVFMDCLVEDTKAIRSIQDVYDFMEELSRKIDMTLVYPPIVARFPFAQSELEHFVRRLKSEGVDCKTLKLMEELLHKRSTEDSGVSGISVWLESHCSIHTWPEEKFFSFDAYSCKDFDPFKCIELVIDWFDVSYASIIDTERYIGHMAKIRVFEYKNGELIEKGKLGEEKIKKIEKKRHSE